MNQGATTASRPNVAKRFYAWLTAKHNTSLVVLLALSIGLAMAAVQIDEVWLLTVFSIIWAATFIGVIAQFWGRHEAAQHHPVQHQPA